MGFVQSANNTFTVASGTVTMGSAPTVNNCLIGMVGVGNAASAVSSFKNGTAVDHWAKAKAQASTSNNCEIWTDQGLASSNTAINIVLAAAQHWGAYVVEWNGVATSAAVDATNGSNTTTGTFSSGASGTLAQAQEVIFGASVTTALATVTYTGPSSPWTNLTGLTFNTGGGIDNGMLGSYEQVSATTSQTYTGTVTNSSTTSSSVIVTLKLSGSITVNLPLLTINSAAFALSPPIYVNLPLLQINSAAHNVTPQIPIIVNLPPLRINSAGFPVTPDVLPVPPKLLYSITSIGVTSDGMGNAVPNPGATSYFYSGGTLFTVNMNGDAISWATAPGPAGPFTTTGEIGFAGSVFEIAAQSTLLTINAAAAAPISDAGVTTVAGVLTLLETLGLTVP